jgi:hypothetical protein
MKNIKKPSASVDKVAAEEKITFIRHGVAATHNGPNLSHREIVEKLRTLRGRVKKDKMSVKEMIKEGRK